MSDTPQQGLAAPAPAGAPMTEEQLQTLSDLVDFAHAEYDGCQSHIEDLERFDRLLADMKIACARPFSAESVPAGGKERFCGVDLAKEPPFTVLQIMRFPGETDEQFRDRVNRALAELDSTRPAPTRNPSNSRPKNTSEIGQFGKPKSIMDIVAGIRGIADNMESAAKKFDAEHAKDVRCRKHPHCFRHDDLMREVEYLRELADRIEAAAEREGIQRDKVSFRCGDCAKFGCDCDAGDVDGNEDCIACEKFRRRAATCNAAALREALLDSNGLLEELAMIGEWGESAREQIAENKAALAAPPRNCDRFATLDDALKAHCAYCERRQTPQPHCLGCRDMMCSDCLDCFADWLFAPAKGKDADNG